jgi:hypothetical protein
MRSSSDLKSASSQSGAEIMASSSESAPVNANYSDFQVELKQYLKSASRSSEEVCVWIRENTNEEINPPFIRALVTAVTESCIDGKPVFNLFRSHLVTIYVRNRQRQ